MRCTVTLLTSSSLKLLQFVADFSPFHRNFVCSVYLLAVGFTWELEDHHKPRLTIICHSIFVFLANVWKIAPQSAEENPRNPTKFDLLGKVVWQVFILDQSATTLHKARENWTCKGVTLICHALSFDLFTEFYFKTSRVK